MSLPDLYTVFAVSQGTIEFPAPEPAPPLCFTGERVRNCGVLERGKEEVPDGWDESRGLWTARAFAIILSDRPSLD